jgi:FkbH-like protein
MKKIAFLSNTITNGFSKYLKEYSVIHFDLDTIIEKLNSKIDSDYLIILLDKKFYFENFINKEAFENIELLKELLLNFREKNSSKILLSNISSSLIDINSTFNIEEYRKLISLNERIEELTNEISDLAIINIFNLSIKYGTNNLFNLKNSFLFQTPYTKLAIEKISDEIIKKIKIFESKRKKVIVLDADNTLWGGIIGEDGVEGIACDENYPGVVYRYFQNQMKFLKESGLVLCLVSKNNYNDAKEPFEKKDMPLKWDDFVIKKVNWLPKSQNIKDISIELNVGIDSLIFFDDNEFELAEVKGLYPQVECVKIDKDNPIINLSLVEKLTSLHSLKITAEDRDKTNQYLAEQRRSGSFKDAKSIDDFIKTLDIKITYWINNFNQIARITQLVNKTNQFNLTTKRYTQTQIQEFMKNEKVFSFKVEDKFGDMGIVGVIIVIGDKIDTFLLSCRVLGRGIEDKILELVIQNCDTPLFATYIKSQKNSQVEELYEEFGFELISKTKEKKEYKFKNRFKTREFIKVIRGDT